jgi:hypothetical protein
VERHSCPLPLTLPFMLILPLSQAGRMIVGGAADSPVENSMQADSKKAQPEVLAITLSNSSLEAGSGLRSVENPPKTSRRIQGLSELLIIKTNKSGR